MEHQHKEIMHTSITTIQQCYGFHGNRISTTGSMKSHANKSNQTLITVSSQWVKSLFTRSSRKSFIRKYHAKEWQCLYIKKKSWLKEIENNNKAVERTGSNFHDSQWKQDFMEYFATENIQKLWLQNIVTHLRKTKVTLKLIWRTLKMFTSLYLQRPYFINTEGRSTLLKSSKAHINWMFQCKIMNMTNLRFLLFFKIGNLCNLQKNGSTYQHIDHLPWAKIYMPSIRFYIFSRWAWLM